MAHSSNISSRDNFRRWRSDLEWLEPRLCLAGVAFHDHLISQAGVPSPYLLQVVDIDSDGDSDMLYSSRREVGWLENTDGMGSFSSPVIIDVLAGNPQFFLTDDVDGDNDTDILVSLFGDHTLWLLENLGEFGQFRPARNLGLNGGKRYSLLADVDGDGDRDIVGTDYNGQAIHWYENQGGEFGKSFGEIATGIRARTTPLVHDIDSDGDNDLIVASSTGTFLLENVDNGQQFQPRPIGNSNRYEFIKLADLDDDGDLDLLAADTIAAVDQLFWLENTDGASSFSAPMLISDDLSFIQAVEIGDLDGDEDLDIVVGSGNNERIVVFENTGDEDRFVQRSLSTSSISLSALALVDLNVDGLLDVVYTEESRSVVAWYENVNSADTFVRHVTSHVGSAKATILAATDMDADGDVDFLTSALQRSEHVWFENDRALDRFRAAARPFTRASHLIMLDLDGDDISEPFATLPQLTLADVNGDGHLDFVRAHRFARHDIRIHWYENLHRFGEGVYGPPRDVGRTGLDATIISGDIDGDGDQDVASINASIVAWHENADGHGLFTSQHTVAEEVDSPSTPITGTIVDLDRDGDLDIVYVARRQLTWHENDGNGNFGAAKSQNLSGDPNTTMAISDLDADGHLDVLLPLTMSYPSSVLAWYGFKDGQLSLQQMIAEDISPIESLAVVDVDGDQDLDVLYSSDLEAKFGWFESTLIDRSLLGDADHDGNVDFTDFSILVANFGKHDAVWEDGDFDSDGNVTFDDFAILITHFDQPRSTVLDASQFAR